MFLVMQWKNSFRILIPLPVSLNLHNLIKSEPVFTIHVSLKLALDWHHILVSPFGILNIPQNV